MSDSRTLLETWKQEGFVNPGSLAQAHDAILLLVARIEALEAQVQALSKKDK